MLFLPWVFYFLRKRGLYFSYPSPSQIIFAFVQEAVMLVLPLWLKAPVREESRKISGVMCLCPNNSWSPPACLPLLMELFPVFSLASALFCKKPGEVCRKNFWGSNSSTFVSGPQLFQNDMLARIWPFVKILPISSLHFYSVLCLFCQDSITLGMKCTSWLFLDFSFWSSAIGLLCALRLWWVQWKLWYFRVSRVFFITVRATLFKVLLP